MKVKWPSMVATVLVAMVAFGVWSGSRAASASPLDRWAFVRIAPTRIIDTRASEGPRGQIPAGGRLDAEVVGRGEVPVLGAAAVAIEVTTTNATGPGVVTAFPAGSRDPGVARLAVTGAGQTDSGSMVVPVGLDGKISLFASIRLDLVADVTGYWLVSAGEQDPEHPGPGQAGPGVASSLHAEFLAKSSAALTTRQKGDALEEYVCAVFCQLSGLTVHERHLRDDAHVQEIDVLLWNEGDRGPDGLSFLPHIILVEAKNWTRAVGAAEVAWFKEKVRTGGDLLGEGAVGILVAASGVTRDGADRHFAAAIIRHAREEGISLLVVRPEQLACDAAGLRELLRRRLCDLAAGRVGVD